MAADTKFELIPATSITANGDTTGKAQLLPPDATDFLLIETVSSRTDGTYTAKLQFSFDGGTTWLDVKESDDSTVWSVVLSADGSSYSLLTNDVPVGTMIRGVITAGSVTTGATATLNLMFGRQRR